MPFSPPVSNSLFSSASPDMTLSPSPPTPVMVLKELVAKLYHEQKKVQELVGAMGFALRSLNNLNQFLELTPLMATRVTDADGSLLILFEENQQTLFEHIHTHQPQLKQTLKSAIQKVKQVDLKNTEVPFSFLQFDQQLRLALTMIASHNCPILKQNQEVGRLYIFSHDRHYAWTPMRRMLLQFIADQTAVAIANRDLNQQLQNRESQDRELEIASEIQNQLLPRCCPQIWGLDIAADSRAASSVGGDYYDFIPTNYDQLRQSDWMCSNSATPDVPWSIVIGDVMGKGVPAGLIMTMTRGMLRAEVLNRHSPAQILRHLNRVMYADLENSHRFVTLFYSEYDPKTGILSYSNAAHHPPLLWRAETQNLSLLDTNGALIGLEADSEFYDAQIQLLPGDVVLYYTDGLTDAGNAKGLRFDEQNLQDAFQHACENQTSAQAILTSVYQAVETFIDSDKTTDQHLRPARDDMTLVVLRVRLTQ